MPRIDIQEIKGTWWRALRFCQGWRGSYKARVRRKGLRRFFLEQVSRCREVWDRLPYNVENLSKEVRGFNMWKVAWVEPESARAAYNELARIAGWLRWLVENEPWMVGVLYPQGRDKGVYSPYTLGGVYFFNTILEKGMSPGEFTRRFKKIRWRADQILKPYGLRASKLACVRMTLHGRRSSGKAAFQAAGETVGTYRRIHDKDVMSVREAKEVLANKRLWTPTPRMVYNKEVFTRVMGLKLPLSFFMDDEDEEDGERDIHPLTRLAMEAAPHKKRIRKMWGVFRRGGMNAEELLHSLLALMKIWIVFGAKGQTLIDRARRDADPYHPVGGWIVPYPDRRLHVIIHDLGIDLEVENMEWWGEGIKTWMLKVPNCTDTAEWKTAIRAARNWDWLLEEGWNPNGKGAVEEAGKLLKRLGYDGAVSHELSKEAARWGYGPKKYKKIENRWLRGLEKLDYQTVPAPGGIKGFMDGDLWFHQLHKEDPRAIFAGDHTNCCQHPGGEGGSSAWHSHESTDGAVWAVERHGDLVAQGWVWRDREALVVDNIEGLMNDETRERVKQLFIRAAQDVVAHHRLGISVVYAGNRYTKVKFKEFELIPNPRYLPAAYSDAKKVCKLAEAEAEAKGS